MKLKKGLQHGETKQGGHGRRHDGFNERYFDGQGAEWEPCPGCKKCEPHNGYVLRKGSWRPTRSHEHVFILAKSSSYWCDGDAVRTPIVGNGLEHRARYASAGDDYNNRQAEAVGGNHGKNTRPLNPLGANLRDVLTLGPEPCGIALILDPSPDCPVHAGQPGPLYVDRPPPSWKRCTCERTSHFAAFPTTLCRPFLEAFCPQRCCAECGTGWVRVVETERVKHPHTPGAGGRQNVPGSECSGNSCFRTGLVPVTTTLGWRPACNCNSQAEPVPGLTLDCFSGTGTLALTARRMGLRAIGVELSPAYALLSRERIRRDSTLFNEVMEPAVPAVPPSPELDLFDTLED